MSLSFEAESGEARNALGSPKACVWFPQSPRGFLFCNRGALVGGLDRRWWRWPLLQTSPGCWVEFGWTRVLHMTEMQTDVGWSSGFPTLLSVGSRQGKQADWGGEFQPSWPCRQNWGMIYYALQLCAQRMLFLVSSQLRMCSASSKNGDSRLNLSRAATGLLSWGLSAPSCNKACVCRCQAWKEQSLACKIEGNSWWKPKRRKNNLPNLS